MHEMGNDLEDEAGRMRLFKKLRIDQDAENKVKKIKAEINRELDRAEGGLWRSGRGVQYIALSLVAITTCLVLVVWRDLDMKRPVVRKEHPREKKKKQAREKKDA